MRHKLVIVIAVIVLAGMAWYGLSGTSTTSVSPLSSDTVDASGPDQDLVETLLALRAVKLDGTILSEPVFGTLKDFSTAIVPEPVGRANPFAPLTASAAPSASTTKSAQIFTPGKPTTPQK